MTNWSTDKTMSLFRELCHELGIFLSPTLSPTRVPYTRTHSIWEYSHRTYILIKYISWASDRVNIYINITFVLVLYSNKYWNTVWHSTLKRIMFQSFNMKSTLRTIDNQTCRSSYSSAHRSADGSARNIQRWNFLPWLI